MPFDSNGNFSLVPGTIVSDGMTIQPSQHNPPFQDVANGLSQVVLRDGRSPWTGNQNANGNRLTNLGSAVNSADAVTFGQVEDVIYRVGDYKDTARALGNRWLRRDGNVYEKGDYPLLAALMPSIPGGVTWITKNPPQPTSNSRSVAISETSIVSVGQRYANVSTDGNTWTRVDIGGGSSTSYYGVAYGAGVFVVVTPGSTSAYISNDGGVTWSPSLVGQVTRTISYGGGIFLAGGGELAPTPNGYVYASSSGTSWSQVLSGLPHVSGTSSPPATCSGNGIHVVVGTNGANYLRVSTDGTTWTTPSYSPFRCNGVTFGDGKFLFLTDTSVISTPDMINFSTYAHNAGGAIYDATFVDGRGWIGVGSGGVATASNLEGTSWTRATSGIIVDMFSIVNNPFFSSKSLALRLDGRFQEATYGDGNQFRVPDDNPDAGWIKAL